MPQLSPPTLTQGDQRAILRATSPGPPDLLPGPRDRPQTGRDRRLNVGDVYTPEGRPRNHVRLRPESPRAAVPATCSCPTP